MTSLQPERPKGPLAEQAWFVSFLADLGFFRSSPTSFSNGKASIQLDGSTVVADPGTGEKPWSWELAKAPPATLRQILQQLLTSEPFLTEEEVAQRSAQSRSVQRALLGLATTIQANPGTDTSLQLRGFLWSLYNQHHLVSLWQLTTVLDAKRAAWVSKVLSGALSGLVKEADLKRALLAAGEMERWEQTRRADRGFLQKLDQVQCGILDLVASTPPSHAHTELVDLLSRFTALKREILDPESSP